MGVAEKINNIFEVDLLRQKLANENRFDELLKTYSSGYPEFEELSTSEKWDDLSEMDTVPEVRLRRLEKVVEMVDPKSKILDIGPGWGDIIPLLKKKNEKVDYCGIDFSAEIVKRLQEKYPQQKFIHTSVEGVKEKFDYVLVLEVMEHILPSKIFNFLRDVQNVIKDNGYLIITVPFEELSLHTLTCSKCGSYVNRMGHVRSYSLPLIKAELNSAGFSVVEEKILYHGYDGFKGSIKRTLRNIAGYLLATSGYKPVGPGGVLLKCIKNKKI